MIPKRIHYCWFGKKQKPKKVLKCIASWKRVCPEYEIIEWNEDNFDVYQSDYLKYCYDNQKWAFFSDLARLLIIRDHGGIYLDTDVELLKNPSELLEKYDAFYGFETEQMINTGLGFGAVENHITVNEMISEYLKLKRDAVGRFELQTCPQLNTSGLKQWGLVDNGCLQIINHVIFCPTDYFNPYDDPTGKLKITENTFSIHWYSKSWMNRSSIIRSRITQPFHRIFGVDCFRKIRKII